MLTAVARVTLLVEDQQRGLERHDVEVWDVRDDGHSRSLHLRDVAGNVLVVAELRP